MRKVLISLAAAGAALAIATPAAAQYYPAPQPYGYGYSERVSPYAYQARIDRLHRHVHMLAARRAISRSEARHLNRDVDVAENRLRRFAYGGLDRREAYEVERAIAHLERAIYRSTRDGYAWDNHHHSGYDNRWDNGWDRDRDGRDDRYENDHGWDHDD